jgi:putative ABC transport system substrate-binding protein
MRAASSSRCSAAQRPLWPLAARAQQPDRVRRVGVLMGIAEDDPEAQPRIAASLAGLQAFGWKDGRNVRIDYRWAADDTGRAFPFTT